MKRVITFPNGQLAAAELTQVKKGPGVMPSDVGRWEAEVPGLYPKTGDTVEEACDNLAHGNEDSRPVKRRHA